MSQRNTRVPSAPLGDDRERKAHHDRLLDSIRAQPCPAASEEWRLVGRKAPAAVQLAVGDGIKLADSLKILVQYARVMGQACGGGDLQVARFMSGHRDTCTGALAWFAPLVEPLRDVSHMEATFARYLDLWALGERTQPDEHLAFEVHQAVPHEDVDFTRYLLSLSFPGSREFEVLVAQNVLRLSPEGTLADFKAAFGGWRGAGLLHPLLVAARFMPTLNDWLPVDQHREAQWFGDLLARLNGAASMEEVHAALDPVGLAFAEGSEPGLLVAAALDRLGVLMRVKSNSPGHDLDAALRTWTLSGHSQPREIWAQARRQLESAMPPSVLCPRLFGAKRDSWGYAGLTLQWCEGALSIAERELTFVPKLALPTAAPRTDPALRVQDVASRMGEIALSPEMGQLMMFAMDGKEFLETGRGGLKERERLTCEDPRALLSYMDAESERYMSPASDVEAFQRELEAGLPQVVTEVYARPKTLVCWRLDPPARIVLFTGTASAAVGKAPGELPKRLLDERSAAKSVARVRLAGAGSDPEDLVAKEVLYYVHKHFQPVEEVSKRDPRPLTHTSLPEALACFARERAVLHTKVALHSSVRWDNQ